MSPPATWTSFPRWPNLRGLLCHKTGTVTPSSLGCSHSRCAGRGALVHLLCGRLPATGPVIHAQLRNITDGLRGFPDGSAGKESACNAGDPGSIPGSGRSPGEGDRLPTPVFLGFPGGSGGQAGLCPSAYPRAKQSPRPDGDGCSVSLFCVVFFCSKFISLSCWIYIFLIGE